MGSNTSGGGDDTRRVLDAIRRVVQSLRESSRWAERHVGLTGAQLFVMQRLRETPGISVNELARRTHTHQSSVSTVVARLVEQGLIVRTPSESDRRSVLLSLSNDGRRKSGRAPDVPQERLIRAIERLSVPRRRQLSSALEEIVRGMTDAEGAPSMFFEDGRRRRPVTRE